jgi:uncharacterized protein YndB with AHSA1/START domain/uncharacterized protein YciI
MTEPAPVRREIVVGVEQAAAFALFTAHLGSWWPLADFSVFGTGSTVAFEAGELVERLGSERAVWAEVLDFDPPNSLKLSWHPGDEVSRATELTVQFLSVGGSTKVRLEHRGWQRLAEPQAARDSYDQGWPTVLGFFERQFSSDAETLSWHVLLHQPGPAVQPGQSVFEHPDFAEHVAFLQRMAGLGILVAAGPLPAGELGSGMTVLRVRPDVDVAQLATEDDLSVVRGLLSVQIAPWDVRFTGTG